jgi:hypothetical protein
METTMMPRERGGLRVITRPPEGDGLPSGA